jgi:nucleotidyltransferase AbiEii toxin of type IV toxin-antitoxin system
MSGSYDRPVRPRRWRGNSRRVPVRPIEARSIDQRYSDAPPATLRVLTLPSFVASKTVAWQDRAATRDLFDLGALARIGGMTPAAAHLFSAHGPTGEPPREWMFRKAPSEADWTSQLANQTRLEISAAEALVVVRNAWRAATS